MCHPGQEISAEILLVVVFLLSNSWLLIPELKCCRSSGFN
ncbi:hypothetical protein ECSTECEH250_4397 [Escherichia coli STEC_EH250]|nr:hypothetical protein ECSTECEH250_4397 [Escherichia coli STEC_EH250]